MGHILDETPEMGEYGGEVRNESFYLSGEDTHDWRYNGAPRPRHAPILYVDSHEVTLSAREMTPDDRERAEWIIDRHQINDPIVLKAIRDLIEDGKAARERRMKERSTMSAGTIEFLIEDIPKIRAVLDAVEKHVQERDA